MASTYTGCRSLWVSRVLRSVRTHWTWPDDMERRLLSSSVPKVTADSPLLGMRSSSFVFPTRCCLEAARSGGLGEHFAASFPPRPWHRNHSLGRCCRLVALCNSQVCYLPADPGFCQRPVPRGLWEGGARWEAGRAGRSFPGQAPVLPTGAWVELGWACPPLLPSSTPCQGWSG